MERLRPVSKDNNCSKHCEHVRNTKFHSVKVAVVRTYLILDKSN